MADRIPLIFNTSVDQIQEVPTGDQLVIPDVDCRVGLVTAEIYSSKVVFEGTRSLTNTNFSYFQVGDIQVAAGSTIVVGAGVSYFVI